MLLVQLPLADIDPPIWPIERSFALFQVVAELAHILATVLPFVLTSTLHLVLLPVALVCVTVGPGVDSVPTNVILLELTGVGRPVRPGESTLAMFFTASVGSLVLAAVGPGLETDPVLVIVDPLALIGRPVDPFEKTVTMGLIIDPMTDIDITIVMDKSTNTIGFIFSPLSLVDRTIWPYLHASASFIQFFSSLDCPFTEICRTLILCLLYSDWRVHGEFDTFRQVKLGLFQLSIVERTDLGSHFIDNLVVQKGVHVNCMA